MMRTTNNETMNNTITMEDGTMMNYKEMKWVDVVAYAKGLGINTGHKKRYEIEADIEEYFANQNVVPVGDMSSDKYYPELQNENKSPEELIMERVNKAKFTATYCHNKQVILVTSLRTIIKHNLDDKHRNHEMVDVYVEIVIKNMIKKGVISKCTNRLYEVK